MAGMGLGPLLTGFVSEHLFDGPTSLGKALALVTALSLTIGMSFTNFVWPNDFTSFYTTHGEL